MKIFKNIIILTIILLLSNSILYASDIVKIGVIDFQKILMESEAGKNANAIIQAKHQKMKAILLEKKEVIDKLKAQYEKETLVLSSESREERVKEYQDKIKELRKTEKNYLNKLKNEQNKLLQELRNDVVKIVEGLAKSEKYLVILPKTIVVYHPSTIDITDKIIEKHNEVYTKK